MDDKKRENSGLTVFSGIFWKFGERICAQGVSFLVSIVLARLLLPSEYGIVSLIIVFINIANVFVTSGLSSALIQKKDADEKDFATVFWCTVALSVALYIILYLLSPFVAEFYSNPELTLYLRIFSLKILISAYNSIQHAYVSRHMIFKKFFFSTIIGTVISGVVGILMAYLGFGAWAIIAQYLINSLIDTLVLNITVPWKPKFIFSIESAKSLLGFGWKVLATDLLGTVFDNLRSLLIGRFYTSADLAYYNKGQQFPALIGNNIDTTIVSVLFPAMSNANDDCKRVKGMTRRSMKTSSYIIFPMMAGLIATAKPLVTFLLTEKWLDCVVFLQLLCVSQAMTTISKANLQAIKALGRSDITLKLEFIKKPLYLIILLLAIRKGVLAIAVSMVIYSFIAAVINMFPNKSLLDYGIKEQIMDLLPATLFSLVMGIVVIQFNVLKLPNICILILQILVGVFIYIGLSILSKNDSFHYITNIAKGIIEAKRRVKIDE